MSEESEQFMEQIQGLVEEERRLLKKNKRNFIFWNICVVVFTLINCLCIYFIATDLSKDIFIPILMACFIFMALSIYYAIRFGRNYYRIRDGEIARRERARVRIPLSPQNEEFEEESDSRSSPADSNDPAVDGPSILPQTESSTLSEQTSTQGSSEKSSLSDSTKSTFITTAIIEHVAVPKTTGDAQSAAKEKITGKKEEGSKPSSSSQLDSTDNLTTDAESEDETGKVRHRRLTPE